MEPEPKLTEVYWNYTRGLWALRDAKTKEVYDYRGMVCIRGAQFHVRERGRDVARRNRRNIHAWVSGEVVDPLGPTDFSDLVEVKYDPKTQDWFERVDREGYEVYSSPWVEMFGDRSVWALFEEESW